MLTMILIIEHNKSDMYICICLAITESKINQLLTEGATSLMDVTGACGAGSDCGSCLTKLHKMLKNVAQNTIAAAPNNSQRQELSAS
jgi:bacterioferritin-associated ferredoxin